MQALLHAGSPTGVGNTTATPLDSPGTVLSADSQVSPLSAGLMTVALSFHSLLEVGLSAVLGILTRWLLRLAAVESLF